MLLASRLQLDLEYSKAGSAAIRILNFEGSSIGQCPLVHIAEGETNHQAKGSQALSGIASSVPRRSF